MQEQITLSIEALIFASEKSITEDEILEIILSCGFETADAGMVSQGIVSIEKKYNSGNFAIRLVNLDGGYQFLTDKAHFPVINQLQVQRSKKRLSQAAMETLAIIAYRQPVTKVEIEQIRGVSSDYTIQKLLEKELIHPAGKAEGPGRPLLYATSGLFMDYFGINSPQELPRMKDISSNQNEIGVISE